EPREFALLPCSIAGLPRQVSRIRSARRVEGGRDRAYRAAEIEEKVRRPGGILADSRNRIDVLYRRRGGIGDEPAGRGGACVEAWIGNDPNFRSALELMPTLHPTDRVGVLIYRRDAIAGAAQCGGERIRPSIGRGERQNVRNAARRRKQLGFGVLRG